MRNEMTNEEAIDMMRRSSAEIKMLRAHIDRLAPKAEAYDNLAAVLHLLPRASQGMGEDIAWLLDKRVKELLDAKAPVPAEE